MSLYDLSAEFAMLDNNSENNMNTDIDEQAFNKQLDEIKMAMNKKMDNIASLIDNNKSDIEGYKQKINRLQRSKKALERKNEALMNYLTACIDTSGITKLKTPRHTLKVRNYKPSVYIWDEKVIPQKYQRVVPEQTVPDKVELYEALINGEKVSGAELNNVRRTVID